MIYSRTIPSPLGAIRIEVSEDSLLKATFCDEEPCGSETHPLLDRVQNTFDAYFAGAIPAPSFPLAPQGTAFQLRVWEALCAIPYGETRSYGQIARAIGRPEAARAVGMAIHNNPILVLIPCHRVLGADGSLTGFAAGLSRKRALLQLEGVKGFDNPEKG